MKIFKLNITILFSLCIMFQSCLDMEPQDQLADTNLWQNAEHFNLFTSQFYGWTFDFKNMDGSSHFDGRSDLVTGSTKDVYSNGTNTIPSNDKNYTEAYERIRQINILLESAASYVIPEDIKRYVGEAHFFRAYLYFGLVQMYGDVIIVKNTLDISSPELFVSRDDRGAVIDFIIEELEMAIEELPAHSAISSSDAGRVSSQAAQAFLSRVALYEGTWQKFRGNTDRAGKLLDIAAKAADEVIKSNEFTLFKPASLGTEAYRYMFILEDVQSNPANVTKSANNEYIFTRRHHETISTIGTNISVSRFGNSSVMLLTRKLANMYLCSDGLPIDKSSLFQGYNNLNSEFQNRDNRMNNTFMIGGGTYWNHTGPRISWQGDEEDIQNAAQKSFNPRYGSGYHTHKWATERLLVTTNESYDYPVIRYAEVLLNYAEAVFERDGNISDEDLNKSLNLVRWRVNPSMPGLSNNLVSANSLDMRTEIRRERTIELFDEAFRIDDLKRWKTAETEMPQDVLGVKYNGTEFSTNWTPTNNKNAEGCLIMETGRKWEEKHYLLPLPADQLQLNPNLKQNPGWE